MSYISETDLGNLYQAFVFSVLVKKCTVPNKQAAVMLPYICADNSFRLLIPIDTAECESMATTTEIFLNSNTNV